MTGSTLSHYRILAELGRGGMGVVYKAEDVKLDRTVAIKVLPSAALATEDDKARFYREAKAAAKLHHPNIASVFEIDEAIPSDAPHGTDPSPFIAMEFIEGETLEARIKSGPLKLDEAVRITSEVAEGLKAAHTKDIVHRDIKAANVMLDGDGRAKILDFGLALTAQSTKLTRMGSTLGTVAYMSPEQARGEEVDGRTDIWALGVTLYEMVAGRHPFGGDYEQAIVYSILNEEPEPLTAVRTGVPMGLEWIVNKMTAKEARHRYQAAADLIVDLETVDLADAGLSRRSMKAVPASGPSSAKIRSIPNWVWAALIIVFVAGLASGRFSSPSVEPDHHPQVRFLHTLESGDQFWGTNRSSIAIAPDGQELFYLSTDGLVAKDLSQVNQTRIVSSSTRLRSLFIDPAGIWVGAWDVETRTLVKIRILDGSRFAIVELEDDFVSAHWAEDGYIYFATTGDAVYRVQDDGGSPELLFRREGTMVRTPRMSPNGKHILYVEIRDQDVALRIADMNGANDRLLARDVVDPRFTSVDSRLIVHSNEYLYHLPFDVDDGMVTGELALLEEDIIKGGLSHQGQYDFSRSGTLVKMRGQSNVEVRGVEWILANGARSPLQVEPGRYLVPRVSANGSRVLLTSGFSTSPAVVYDEQSKSSFTMPINGAVSVLSPDGSQIAYHSLGELRVYDLEEETDQLIHSSPGEEFLISDWSADGRYLFFSADRQGLSNSTLAYYDVETETRVNLVSDAEDNDFGRLSPDGNWLAFERGGEGAQRIHVTPFPAGGPSIEVQTIQTAEYPVWGPGGNALYYVLDGKSIARTSFDPESGELGTSDIAFIGPLIGAGFRPFDVHPQDGRLIVLTASSTEIADPSAHTPSVEVSVNWTDQIQ